MVAAVLLWLGLIAGWVASAAELPNVVLIVADDLGAHDLACTGSKFHETPNLDRLAAGGMRFTQAYAACTVCSPTRAAILTGKHPARLKLTDWISGHDFPQAKLRPPAWIRHLEIEELTLAERLKAQGYATAHIGKWHLGNEGFEPERQGFDVNLGGDHRGQSPSYFAPYGLPRLADGPAGEYLTDREAAEAVKFIAGNKQQRLFLNYWPYAVHTPLQAPAELTAKYEAKAKRLGGAQTNAVYAAMIERLDAAVGRILQALEDSGLADRTLVIFTSDNGGLVLGTPPSTSNAPLRAGKGSAYEGGHRVPLLIRWPGVARAGVECPHPVVSMDLAMTILQAAGRERGSSDAADFDGVSLVPLLSDPAARLSRTVLFWHYPHYHPGGAAPYAAMRDGDWKLIQSYEDGRHQLFDLRRDPGESTNLAEADPVRVMKMARELFARQGRLNAQWPMANANWQPPLIIAQSDGTIRLHARDAFVRGRVLRYEPQRFKDTLGWWTQPDDWASWMFELSRGGRYELAALQGCGTGSGGSEVRFSIGDGSLTTTVIETGGFQNFTHRVLGELTLGPGRHTLEVRPLRKPGVAVMDLREVILRPVNGTP